MITITTRGCLRGPAKTDGLAGVGADLDRSVHRCAHRRVAIGPCWPVRWSYGRGGELALPATAGQADSTRFVSATLTKVVRLDCEEADPGVPGSVCIKVTAQLAGGRQVTLA